MLQQIRINHFRSIETMDLYFDKITNICGKNGAGKTNILQAILCIFQNKSLPYSPLELIRHGDNVFFLEALFTLENGLEQKLSISFDKINQKKLILLNGKKVTKKVLGENILKISYFSPLSMNLFYLGPKNRRDFLDEILFNIYPEYDQIIKNYEKITKNRNKILKNIFEEKSQKQEIQFWDEEFIKYAKMIYSYRIPLITFIQNHMSYMNDIFPDKNVQITFEYVTKTNLENISGSIQTYLQQNFERDIILGKTHIGPHIDDFDIKINGTSLLEFASRGEMKSIIIELKLLEILYIEKITKHLPVILIDDFGSELDTYHINMVLEKLKDLQIIFTSILALNKENHSIINI